MTHSHPDLPVDRAPQSPPSASGDTDMRRLYVGVLLVETVTLLVLWFLQQYFTL